MALLTQQPIKGVYLLGALGFEIARLPLALVKNLASFGRAHPEWSFRQTLGVHAIAAFIRHVATIQQATPLPLEPGAEGERFVLVKPASSDAYKGPLRSNADVEPVEIGATWYPAPLIAGSERSNVCVVLHMHGGAFVVGDGRTQGTGYMAKTILKQTSATHVFCPQYRLSTLPASKTSNPFPAALQDGLTAYLYLINDLNISPEDIIIAGDSAGGNATMSILRYLSEYGAALGIPNPSAALLWSPWINPADTTGSPLFKNDNYATDYLCGPFTVWGTAAYAGLAGNETLKQPYVSHKNRTFKTETPLFVNTGGAEVLYYDVVEWAENMKNAGNNVQLDVEKIAPHDIILLGDVIGFQTEATNSAKRAGEWLKEVRR
ncbi:alpha/beta-hydrolase [Plenodomus tracheiphilus IPT5]|uniref:Alpha/beta-hydrolase n=1 Tax=Plenodomus tracheiphilus IPT5 TaxID=1408161 RepID=A0A6A7AVZ5_9PLEO|nr:alpha/beta-hydrolase [Plenodomus tracheiphilus IPT5]